MSMYIHIMFVMNKRTMQRSGPIKINVDETANIIERNVHYATSDVHNYADIFNDATKNIVTCIAKMCSS